MIRKPEQIIQDQVNPSQSRGGLGGLLDYAREQNPNTGLSRMQNFAAALDPLIMPEMRGGEAIRERGMQRVAAGNKNKTIEYLIANALATGSIDAGSAVNFAFQRQAADKEFGKQKELIDYKAQLGGTKQVADIEKYNLAVSQGYKGTYLDFKKELLGATASNKGQEAIDTNFAKEATLYRTTGGATASGDIAKVTAILDRLESGEPLTGPVIGSIPDNLRAIISPESQQAKDIIGGVVQKNLRAILGGQFAQKEGEQLVKRAYNEQLRPEQNAARLRVLLMELESANANKKRMVDYYFDNNMSLRNYDGPIQLPTKESLIEAMDSAVPIPSNSDDTYNDLMKKYGG
jgi:hypothetical protein